MVRKPRPPEDAGVGLDQAFRLEVAERVVPVSLAQVPAGVWRDEVAAPGEDLRGQAGARTGRSDDQGVIGRGPPRRGLCR